MSPATRQASLGAKAACLLSRAKAPRPLTGKMPPLLLGGSIPSRAKTGSSGAVVGAFMKISAGPV
jgi:hypothetical protein